MIRTTKPYTENQEYGLEPERVYPATLETLKDYQKRGVQPVPNHRYGKKTGVDIAKEWLEHFAKRKVGKVGSPDKPVKLEPIVRNGKPMDATFQTTLNNQKFIFRATESGLNYRWAAAKLNEWMGLHTVPRAEYAEIFDGKKWQRGLLSKKIEGTQLDQVDGKTIEAKKERAHFLKLLEQGKIDARSASNAMAFEFLVNNIDAGGHNVLIDRNGQVMVFDNETAFTRGNVFGDSAFFGHLPDKYTKEFVDSLAKINRESLTQLLGLDVTSEQITSTLFRADVIRADIRRRGRDALFEP